MADDSIERQANRVDRRLARLEKMVSAVEQKTKSLADMCDEDRAQRQALLDRLDRLDGPEPGLATG